MTGLVLCWCFSVAVGTRAGDAVMLHTQNVTKPSLPAVTNLICVLLVEMKQTALVESSCVCNRIIECIVRCISPIQYSSVL